MSNIKNIHIYPTTETIKSSAQVVYPWQLRHLFCSVLAIWQLWQDYMGGVNKKRSVLWRNDLWAILVFLLVVDCYVGWHLNLGLIQKNNELISDFYFLRKEKTSLGCWLGLLQIILLSHFYHHSWMTFASKPRARQKVIIYFNDAPKWQISH